MKLRKRTYPTGRVKWTVDLGLVNGRRQQLSFDTKEEARGKLDEAKAKHRAHGDAGFALAPGDGLRFSLARDQLAAVGATIEEATAYFLAHKRKTAREPIPLAALLKQCEAAKKALGKSTRYLQQFKCSCLSFVRGREQAPAHTVTRADVKAWVRGNQWAPKTQRVYLGDLRTLFAYAVGEGFASENPCNGEGAERIELAAMVVAPIQTLTVDEARALLARAAHVPASEDEEDFRPLLFYVVLALFCGIRPAELERMERSQVSLKERHAIVEGHQAKTRRRRVLDISKNAVAWLRLDPSPAGLVVPENFRRRWARLRAAAGWRPEKQALGKDDPAPDPNLPEWPHDVLRHTFASMHYAAHQNESLLKAQMGHSAKEEVLFQHYRALKTRAEAALFWALVPERTRKRLRVSASA